jgi:hypothetical protein
MVAIERMLGDPDLSNPLLEPNFFIDFKRLSELILNVEDNSLLIIKRCSKDDRLLSAVVRQMCAEVGYVDSPPLCGALSFQYFQALLGMDIIMAPQTQMHEVLSVPDLYHELAHFVVFRQRHRFEVAALSLIHQFFVESVRKGRQRGLPQTAIDHIVESHALWAGDWQVEFICDMIATYWCGPSYAWANLRLSATRGDPYQEGHSHPSDDARRIGVAYMLDCLGESIAAKQVDQKWEELKRLSPSAKPLGYNMRYPAALLERLAKVIFEACVDAGFVSFGDQMKTPGTAIICNAVDSAWKSFVKNASQFSPTEAAALLGLNLIND